MKIGILGTGIVGTTLAGKLASLGHGVTLGTRDPAASRARLEAGPYGNPSLASFLSENPAVSLATFADAAGGAELVINATSGLAALDALRLAGASNLAGKVLIDISNPLDFSQGFPPRLSVSNDDSLGERIQREFPSARVVKTLNTVNAQLMVAPELLAGGEHTMFVCGDDAEAKAVATRLLTGEFGWRDVLDLGGIAMSRGTEMYLPLWTRLYGSLKTPMFSIKVVRQGA